MTIGVGTSDLSGRYSLPRRVSFNEGNSTMLYKSRRSFPWLYYAGRCRPGQFIMEAALFGMMDIPSAPTYKGCFMNLSGLASKPLTLNPRGAAQ